MLYIYIKQYKSQRLTIKLSNFTCEWVDTSYLCVHLPVSSFATEGEHALQNCSIYTVNATACASMYWQTRFTILHQTRLLTSIADPNSLHVSHEVIFAYHSTGLHSTSELFLNSQCSSVCETVSHHKGRDKPTEMLDAPKLSECDA